MRLWSIHPSLLDTKGLVALWREGLLAKHVLSGKTTGYRNHPQLSRFQQTNDPLRYINAYLYQIFLEAIDRGYNFDITKIKKIDSLPSIPVTRGQFDYEIKHLKRKLRKRDPEKLKIINQMDKLKPHPLFKLVKGPVESWENEK